MSRFSENAMWAYQYAGSLSVFYDFAEDDIVPLLDHLSAMAEGKRTGNEGTAAVPGSVRRGVAIEQEAASEAVTPLRALSEAATPGPWLMGRDEEGGTHFIAQHGWAGGGPNYYADAYYPQDEADGAFVVASVNYVRELLAATKPEEPPR